MTEQILQPIVLESLAHPSGLVLSPDDQFLYIAETMQNRVLRCALEKGSFHVRFSIFALMCAYCLSVFYQFSGGVGPMELACDSQGNVFVGHYEFSSKQQRSGVVSVLSASGELIRKLEVPAPEITGLAMRFNSEFDVIDVWQRERAVCDGGKHTYVVSNNCVGICHISVINNIDVHVSLYLCKATLTSAQ